MEVVGQALADGRPRPGLRDEDRPPRLEPPERRARPSAAAMPSPMHEVADLRRRPEEDRPAGRPQRDQPVDGVHDARHLRDAVHVMRRGVEPLPRPAEVAHRPDRVAPGHQRPDPDGPAQPLGKDLRAGVQPDRAPGRGAAPSGCAGR